MNNKTRCLIIDDEPLALKLIKSHLSKLPSFEVAGECRNALQAIEFLKKEKIDLMFLDINMPEITGIEFLKTIPDPPYVIITTAFREYAIEGYDLDIVDFLLKPISFERFLKAVNRFISRTKPARNGNGTPSAPNNEKKYIHIQDGKTVVKLVLSDILYLEGYGEYVKVITQNKNHLVRNSLTEFENKLSESNFLRIHKSYIVNVQKISGFTTLHVILKSTQLPIGRIYRDKVMGILKSESSLNWEK
jgi:DNA-binding LytR/AlgR family response regulator